MKLFLLQEQLNVSLAIVSRLISLKTQLPILANVLFKADKTGLKLTATNLETSINLWLAAKVEKEGTIAIPCKTLAEFISSLPQDKVLLEAEKEELKIVCRNYKASFKGMPVTEFPSVPSLREEKINVFKKPIIFKADELRRAINQVAFAAAQDESRPELTGVKIEASAKELSLAATDGYRLSNKTIKLEEEMELPVLIIPAKALMEMVRTKNEAKEEETISLNLIKEGNQVLFSFRSLEIITRLIAGNFPDFRKIIPQNNTTKIIIDKEEFLKAVRAAAILAKDSSNIIKLKVKSQKLKVSANAPEVGSNEIDLEIKQEGEDIEIAFNCRFLLEYLGLLEEKEIVMECSGPLKPGIFYPLKDKSFLHLIMPVRVADQP